MKSLMKWMIGMGLLLILLCGCEKEGVSAPPKQNRITTSNTALYTTKTETSHQDKETTVVTETTTKNTDPVTTFSQEPTYTKQVVQNNVTKIYTKKTSVAVAEKSAVTEAVRKNTTTVKRTSATPTTKKPTTTKPFDINHYLKYAQDKAKSLGYTLDPEMNGTWDVPIRCHAGCKYIERDINDLFSFYQKTEPYLTSFWIWYEEESPGVYNLYFGRG